MRRALVPLVVLLLLSLAPASARADVPADWAGVNAQWLYPAVKQSTGVWDTQTDAMQRAGVKVVRLDAEWRRVEPNAPDLAGRHTYDWRFYDAVVATLAERGIRWYPIVDYSTPWAAAIPGQWRSPPASADTFATYAAALVRRYGRGGTFWAANPQLPQVPVRQWEIWNEQNGAYFWPSQPDPAAYADLYAASRTAIKAVDPDATVVVGGLINHAAQAFLDGMFAARPKLVVDAVGLHPYAPSVERVLRWIRLTRLTLRNQGRGDVPIEVTEVGWTTTGPVGETDERRAALTREVMPAVAAEPGVTRFILHTWMSREAYADQPEDWYGLFRLDATPTLAGQGFIDGLRALAPAPDPTPDATPQPTPTATPQPTASPAPTATATPQPAGPAIPSAPAPSAPPATSVPATTSAAVTTASPAPVAAAKAARKAAKRRAARRKARLKRRRAALRRQAAAARRRSHSALPGEVAGRPGTTAPTRSG